ncbi:MAG: cytochrome C [Rhizobiales bacterium PAR1]|nr:MAG: cytochrome C [Rhizobiales bacterium PAR1]
MMKFSALLFGALLVATPVTAQQPNRALILECMACHGDDGIAKDKDVPHLAGQSYDYLLRQMRNFQSGKRPHKEMKVMSRLMDDSEMQEIADYYSRLPRDPKS